MQEKAADNFERVQYPRMNLRESRTGFVDQWLNLSTRFGFGIMGIFLGLISLAVIAVGLFFLYWLGYFLIVA